MAIQQDWHIQSRATACAGTGRAFAEEEKIVSALFWRDGQYERVDFSEEGWSQRNDNIAPLSHWRHKFESPPPPPPEPLRKDDAESMLRHLLEQNEPAQRNVCYILALMLERKRLLRPLDKQDGEDGPLLIYEHAASGDTWIVHDPQLKLDEIGPVQDEVVRLLDEGLVAAEPTPGTPPALQADVGGDSNQGAPEAPVGGPGETPVHPVPAQQADGREPDDRPEDEAEEDDGSRGPTS
ncbi:MAG: hypothetical protein AAGK14_01465 [Verrucomicrobiota bacterium]